jgi:hypothetical protein
LTAGEIIEKDWDFLTYISWDQAEFVNDFKYNNRMIEQYYKELYDQSWEEFK